MCEFKRYMHVVRLDTDECEGLLNNDQVYVTAKVDGSNGCVWWDAESGRLAVGSRNNLLSEELDNAYFYAWVAKGGEEQSLLLEFCKAHPELIVYGEWMGYNTFVGAFKGYAPSAKGKLIIFDVFDRRAGLYLGDSEWRPLLAKAGLEPYFVKLLAVLDHPNVDDVARIAKANKFLLEGTDYVGEGVVCKVEGWTNRFGRQVYGKLVLDEFRKQGRAPQGPRDVEQQIIGLYLTDAELAKTVAKVCVRAGVEDFDPSSRKLMGMFQSLCWRDLLDECPNWVKKLKNPKVDFSRLLGMCNARTKEYADNR